MPSPGTGRHGGKRSKLLGRDRKGLIVNGEIDTGRLGIEYQGRKIPEKPHCPECGRVYKGKDAKKKGVTVCGWCKRGRKGEAEHIARLDTFVESNDDDKQG